MAGTHIGLGRGVLVGGEKTCVNGTNMQHPLAQPGMQDSIHTPLRERSPNDHACSVNNCNYCNALTGSHFFFRRHGLIRRITVFPPSWDCARWSHFKGGGLQCTVQTRISLKYEYFTKTKTVNISQKNCH